MNGADIFIMIFSMLIAFLLGSVGMLFFGGKTALNYLKVKVSRGRKVLVFGKTSFGWRSFVAKKKEQQLIWKFDGIEQKTNIEDGDVVHYLRVDACFVDANNSGSAIKLKDGDFYPDDFDPKNYSNILIRAFTRPSTNGTDELKKMLIGLIILLIVVGFGVLMVYMKLNELTGGSAGGVI